MKDLFSAMDELLMPVFVAGMIVLFILHIVLPIIILLWETNLFGLLSQSQFASPKVMKEKKHYYTELHTTGIKDSAKHYATESVCAHFSTTAEVGTKEFQQARQEAIEFIGEQQSRGWLGWQTGKTFVETGREEVSCMSPAWDYHKGRTFPVFEEIDVQTLLTPQL